MILAVWVLLKFIDSVDPMAHYPATYPSQIFFLKDNVGYEIVVLYEGEQHLSRLLVPQDEDTKYIFVLPNIRMAAPVDPAAGTMSGCYSELSGREGTGGYVLFGGGEATWRSQIPLPGRWLNWREGLRN